MGIVNAALGPHDVEPTDGPEPLAPGKWAGIVRTDHEGFIIEVLGDPPHTVVLRTDRGDYTLPADTVELRDEPGIPEAMAAARTVLDEYFEDLDSITIEDLLHDVVRAVLDAHRAASKARPHA
jgi:hypothetical protein